MFACSPGKAESSWTAAALLQATSKLQLRNIFHLNVTHNMAWVRILHRSCGNYECTSPHFPYPFLRNRWDCGRWPLQHIRSAGLPHLSCRNWSKSRLVLRKVQRCWDRLSGLFFWGLWWVWGCLWLCWTTCTWVSEDYVGQEKLILRIDVLCVEGRRCESSAWDLQW